MGDIGREARGWGNKTPNCPSIYKKPTQYFSITSKQENPQPWNPGTFRRRIQSNNRTTLNPETWKEHPETLDPTIHLGISPKYTYIGNLQPLSWGFLSKPSIKRKAPNYQQTTWNGRNSLGDFPPIYPHSELPTIQTGISLQSSLFGNNQSFSRGFLTKTN